MAEILLSALLPVVFDKLASLVLNKFAARSKKIHFELKKWDISLRHIRTLLNDASQKEITDESVKDWLIRLQHLAYDMDDILDALATHAIQRELTDHQEPPRNITTKVKKLIPSCFTTSPSSSPNLMHDKLNETSTRLQQLYDEKNNLGLTVIPDGRSKNMNRKYQTSLLQPDIFGRQAEKEFLLKKLSGDGEPKVNQHNFSILPIVGMGGIGKTTLARLLYNEPKFEQHFQLKAWVCVSDEFDSFNISKVIFEATASEENKGREFKDLNLLQEALRDQLSGKRFLLVLDDVWSEKIEDWDTLVPPFYAVAPGSKIIITARKKQLLQQLGNDNPYHLNKLSQDDALSMFAYHALDEANFDSYPTLRTYGEGIVRKCDGLPLALKSLGTSLRTRANEEDWKELLNSKIWNLKDEGGTLPALRVSYQELSASLKQLFAYSSLFPKDYVFEKEDLILLWMAEGFLHESTRCEPMEMERLGEKYFDELLSKSFFEYIDDDKSLFVMHDLMNDLATYVAGEFFVRLDIETNSKYERDSLKRCRHMSFVREEFMACKKFKEFESVSSLRTFLAVPIVLRSCWESFYLSNKILVDLLTQLPLLRALCLSKLQIGEIPESIGDLKHMRYLNLSQTPITHLPDNVCNLYHLQTLIVFGCVELRELPHSFFKLQKLRHFDIRDTPLLKNMPLGIGELKSLQTLSKIVIGGENEFRISKVKNLKNYHQSLSIQGLDKLQNSDEAREANLSQMRLRELEVGWSEMSNGSAKQTLAKEVLDLLKPHRDNLRTLGIISYGGTEFPKWIVDPSFIRLTMVSIVNCRNCVFVPPLGQLPSLKKLYIKSMGDLKEVGSEFLGTGPAFRSLEFLEFDNMPRWEVWSVNAVGVAVFPCLKELDIRNCPNMARWEVWSANGNVGVFPCLEKLSIEKCPELVKVSLEALPSLWDLRINNCGDVLLKSLVSVDSSITKLSIEDISRLSDEAWGGVVQYLGALEELSFWRCNDIRKLEISYCEKLVRIGGGEKVEKEEANHPTSLRMLKIHDCVNLEHLSCPNSIEILDIGDCVNVKHLSCPDIIKTLSIIRCWNLEHLSCPANSIQKLTLNNCSKITSVSFPTQGGGGGGWQKLESLHIYSCSSVLEEELEKQVLTNTNMPMLGAVGLSGCWKDPKSITKFTCFIQQLVNLDIDCCGGIESFPRLQDLTSLKHLGVKRCRSMDGPPPVGVNVGVWPQKLESLSIGKLKTSISEWGPLPTSSLTELHLLGGFGSSSFQEEEDDLKSFPTSSLVIPNSSLSSPLTTLGLWSFKNMESISSEGLQHLTSLRHLTISNCPKMKDLPQTLLTSLLSLKIHSCDELKEKSSYWPLLSHIPKVSVDQLG